MIAVAVDDVGGKDCAEAEAGRLYELRLSSGSRLWHERAQISPAQTLTHTPRERRRFNTCSVLATDQLKCVSDLMTADWPSAALPVPLPPLPVSPAGNIMNSITESHLCLCDDDDDEASCDADEKLCEQRHLLVYFSSFQQRLSYTTLSDLAQALIDGTVYEIVQGLLDIQHLTEKNLYNQRQKLHGEHIALKQDLVRKHKQALQTCKSHNLAVLKSNQRAEAEALDQRVKEEQRMMDEKVVAEMDQKVLDQQNTLEKAGVPGFYITTNPQEVMMQMNLLELVLKLQQKETVSGSLP
ncbi:protein DGCR6-like [Sinocyclocheilus anshuiensis]|uniref:protein DGCR6-like n=1 Tax=Sinocyclocheilus anshuiensis TaxID=1608454 RepID=UPI0007B92764|nr:PREDICTED: protein DGCR6-like [Sinocyclocheilus anshuiensis]